MEDKVRIKIGKYSVESTNSVGINTQAHLAFHLAEHFGIIAGKPDGEDSAGRQRLILLTPEEVAIRATETAAALFQQADSRGWLTEIPEHKTEEK